MKRLLAMFLALTMVMSMIPMTAMPAFAEETLTLEEIMEETIPEETIPEETIPEETIPEEVIPEETIPEETIPEETIPEETIPEETIPEETIPEETLSEETQESDRPMRSETSAESLFKDIDDIEHQGQCGENVYWALTTADVLYIRGEGPMTERSYNKYKNSVDKVVIGSGVTSIVYHAFADYSYLEKVTIPKTVTEIQEGAFASCEKLKSITVPSGVKTIGVEAFERCDNLEKVSIAGSVKSIGERAFEYCDALEEVELNSGLEEIGPYAFHECPFTSITIPGTVTTIGEGAFYNCEKLKSITIPSSVTSMGEAVFKACEKLTSATIKGQMPEIPKQAFYECYKLNKVTLPSTLITIADEAFSLCKVESIKLPEGLTTIGASAFEGNQLSTLTIPKSVTSIGECAFSANYNLKTLTVNAQLTELPFAVFSNCKALTSITLPDTLETIGGSAFSGCDALVFFTLPNSVKTIGHGVFSNCVNLKKVTFNEAITEIPSNAFSGCVLLKSINIPDTVTSIGENAFKDCDTLTSVTIPDSVTSVGKGAFYDCDQLKSIQLSQNLTDIPAELCYGCGALITAEGFDAITTIGTKAFYECKNLEKILLPDTLVTIGERAFYKCGELTEVTIPENVTNIGARAFSSCTKLKSVSLEGEITEIPDYLFENCTSLTHVNWGDNITSIGAYAFNNCGGLLKVEFPEGMTAIGENAFKGCPNLQVIAVGDSLTTIGTGAFNNCGKLNHVLYSGTQDQWTEVQTGSDNGVLSNAVFHYEATGDEVELQWNGISYSGYCDICQLSLESEPVDMADCNLVIDKEFWHTGEQIKPEVTVLAPNGVRLVEGVDYTVSYGTNTKVGSGSVTVTGIGECTGSLTGKFTIKTAPVQNLRVVSTGTNSVKIAFDPIKNAGEYWIYLNGDCIAEIKSTQYTIKDLTCGTYYQVQVQEYKGWEQGLLHPERGPMSEVLWIHPSVKISETKASLEYSSAAYDGLEKTPVVTIKKSSNGSKLTEDIDFEVTYENNVEIGRATVTVTGIGKYGGQMSKIFDIVPQQVTGLEVTELNANSASITFQSVEGAEEYWIYKNGDRVAKIEDTTYTFTGLSAGKTYKFSVKANKSVDGRNYTGEASTTVSAKPFYRFEDCSLQVNYATKAYTGKSITNTFTIKNPDGKTLKKDEDYKVTYENNKDVGTATATITGKGKYTGTLTATFDIVPPKMSTPKVKVEQMTDGTALYITFKTVKHADWFNIYLNGELCNSTGELGYFTEDLTPGTYSVTVAAVSYIDGKKYTGAVSDSVKVTVRHSLKNCTVNLAEDEFVYTGKSIKADVVVYGYNGELLTEGVDYTLVYKNNKSAGRASVEIKGKGNYNGSLQEHFFINPAPVKDLKLGSATKTSVKLSYSKTASAKYYEIYELFLKDDGEFSGEVEYIGTTTSGSYTIKNLEPGDIHYYAVYSVRKISYIVDGKKLTETRYSDGNLIAAWAGTYIGDYKATLEYTTATYTGEAFEPAVTVKTSSKSSATTLLENVDYIVSYENNAGPGKAKVIIQGIGGYTGTITKTFTIAPPKVENVTAVAASNTSIEVSFDAAPGATSYWVYVNGERKAKITDTSCVISGLKKGKTYKITVKSVATVDGTSYTSDYTDAVSCKTVFVPAE